MYIFDLDGTLTDSNGLWREVDDEFLSRRGLQITAEYEETVAKSIFPAAADYTRDYYGLKDSPEEIMKEWEELAGFHYANLVALKPGARRILEECRDAGHGVILFTACRPGLCETVLRRFHLEDCFDLILYAEEIGMGKYLPQSFARLSELIGTRPEDCILLDDSPSNCAAARSAGMTVVGVYDPYYAGQRNKMEQICHRYLDSLEDLAEEIRRETKKQPAPVLKGRHPLAGERQSPDRDG